jgi:hypothetical protein
MQKTKRQSAEVWRGVVAQFSQSGLTEEEFCEREGLRSKLFHRWRVKRSNAPPRTVAAKPARVSGAAAGFVDMGALQGGGSRWEARLDLGGGVVLSVARG